jgi:hypothetical protein
MPKLIPVPDSFDVRVDSGDDIVAEAQPIDRAGREILGKTSAFLTISPRSDFKLTVSDRLLALYIMKQ